MTISLPTLEWLLTRCVTLLGKRYPQLPAELLLPLRGLIGAGQYVVAGVGAFGRLGASAVMQLAPG